MSRWIAALLLVQLVVPAALAGQDAMPATLLRPGARVRITQVGEPRRVGILVALSADTLVVQGAKFANDEALPLERISALEVSTGRHHNVLRRMGMGFAIGAGAGLLLGAVAYQPCTGMCIMAPANRGESAAGAGAFFGTVGLLVGAIAGIPKHDSWQRVQTDGKRVAFAVSPRAAGTGLGVTLRF
jgi:hypothetical protein